MTIVTTVISDAEVDTFAAGWMEAWNAHDLDRIAARYRDDVEYHSPFVARLRTDAARWRGMTRAENG